jgi:IS30 family transposase
MERQTQVDLTALANEIADTPCSALKYETPKSMTLALLRDRSDDA